MVALVTQQPVELILLKQVAGYLATPMFLVDPDGNLLFYNEPAEDPDRGGVAQRGGDADGHPALVDEVQRVARVALVEEDLPPAEAPAASGRQHPSAILLRQGTE